MSLAVLWGLGVDPRRCDLRLLPAAAGMGDVRVAHLLPHLPAAVLQLPLWLTQKQRELESAGKEGLGSSLSSGRMGGGWFQAFILTAPLLYRTVCTTVPQPFCT